MKTTQLVSPLHNYLTPIKSNIQNSLSVVLSPLVYPQHKNNLSESLSDKGNQANGRWTKSEHKLFVEALNKYGKNWNKVANHVKTRNATQVRSHAQKYFLKHDIKQTNKPSLSHNKKEITNDKGNGSGSSTDSQKAINRINELEKLNEIALNDSRILLENASALQNALKVKEQFESISKETSELLAKAADDPKVLEQCLKIFNTANLGVLYFSNIMRKFHVKNMEYGFLMKYMSAYGFTNFKEITSSYIKLSDWVDTSTK